MIKDYPRPPEKGTITISMSQERWYGLLAQSDKVLDIIDVQPDNAGQIVRKMVYLAIDALLFANPPAGNLRYVAGEREPVESGGANGGTRSE
jgi:hypothetical protein